MGKNSNPDNTMMLPGLFVLMTPPLGQSREEAHVF